MGRRRDRGLSLLEILIASAIVVVVSFALYLILWNSTVTYTNVSRKGDIQDRARRLLDEMANEVRLADRTTLQIEVVDNADAITFQVPKRLDPSNSDPARRVVWSGMADDPAFYSAGSPYLAGPCYVRYCYRPPMTSLENGLPAGGQLVRMLVTPPPGGVEIAGTRRRLSDCIKPYDAVKPAEKAGLIITQATDGANSGVRVTLGVIVRTADFRNRSETMLETAMDTVVTLRNSR
jgi:prepilin-type N-terminal cleavage/methylation domain-containing protein